MKTLITFLCLTLICSAPLLAEQLPAITVEQSPANQCFKFFRVHRQGPGVSLSWAAANSNVVSFTIERSYDADFYESITGMGCSGTGTHKYNDNNIFPGTIYYRIAALKTDGTTEYSTVETVRIVRHG